MFGESPKWRTKCPGGVKGQGSGSPLPQRSGLHGKGMVGRLVGESPTFLHADLTLRADAVMSAKCRGTSAHYTQHADLSGPTKRRRVQREKHEDTDQLVPQHSAP